MRSPSQLLIESAAAYVVNHRIDLPEGGSLLPGQFVDGARARSWPTFRQMYGLNWLSVATGDYTLSEAIVPVTKPAKDAPKPAKGRRS
jgi:hypothetical protein